MQNEIDPSNSEVKEVEHLELANLNVNSEDLVHRRNHNASLPLSRLPDEILAAIFETCSTRLRMCPRESNKPHGFGRSLMEQLLETRQIILSHVCHHWRVVALSTVTLWNDLYIDKSFSSEALKEFIRRSQQCRLFLEVYHPEDSHLSRPMSPPDRLPTILRELPRIQVLSLTIPPWELCKDVWSSVSSDSLKTLELHNGNNRDDSPQAIADLIQMFPQLFPQLRTLQVIGFLFDFKRWALPSTLTSLTISNKYKKPDSESDASVVDILDTLRCLPGLREFHWSTHFTSRANLPPSGILRSVSLPLLQKLQLCGFVESHIHLLDYLEFPPIAHAKFEIRVQTFGELSQHRSLSHYVPNPPHLRTLVVLWSEERSTYDDHFSVEGWNMESSLNDRRYMQRPRHDVPVPDVTLSVKAYRRNLGLPVQVSPLHKLLAALTTPHTSTIFLRCSRHEDHAYDVPHAFLRMTSVHTLGIIGITYGLGYSAGVSMPLQHATQILNPVGDNVVFPKLEFLLLDRLDFTKGFEPFLDTIKRRQNFTKLLKIELRDCYYLGRETILALKEVVGECEVHGQTLQ